MALPADAVHLVIDACHGDGLLASRGVIRAERTASSRDLSTEEADRAFGRAFFSDHPRVGALFSSSEGALAHEWSEIEAGLFSYAVVSGLPGANTPCDALGSPRTPRRLARRRTDAKSVRRKTSSVALTSAGRRARSTHSRHGTVRTHWR